MVKSVTKKLRLCLAFMAVLALCANELSALELNRYFSDGMMLQRDKPIKIWGTAKRGDTITVSFAGQTQSATADHSGRWQLTLDPMPANSEGIEYRVSSVERSVTLSNVVVGDIFLFARQSSIDVSRGTTAEGKQAATGVTAKTAYRFIHIKASPSRTPPDNGPTSRQVGKQ